VNGLLSQDPAKGDLFQFGEQNIESIAAIIKEIEPVNKLCARVTCLDYNPAVFSPGEVPAWSPVFSEPTPFTPSYPPVPLIISVNLEDSTTTQKPDGTFLLRVGITYSISSSSLVKAENIQPEYFTY
jgi:hypothetical protein